MVTLVVGQMGRADEVSVPCSSIAVLTGDRPTQECKSSTGVSGGRAGGGTGALSGGGEGQSSGENQIPSLHRT